MSHFTSSYLAFRFKLQNLKSQDPEKKLVNGMALAHPTLYTLREQKQRLDSNALL